MARVPSKTDFDVDVEGIGRFIFARRSIRDTYRIRGEYGALTNNNTDENGHVADLSALGFATISVLVVSQPADFDFQGLDPIVDEEWDDKILKIYMALSAKESSFRPKPAPEMQATGEGAGAHV